MVNLHHEVYRRVGVNHQQDPYGVGTSWTQILGEMAFVATAEEGIVWGIDFEGEVWRYDGGSISIQEVINNVDHGWKLIADAKMIEVDVGYNSQVVGSNNEGLAFFRNGITEELPEGSSWFQFDGTSEHIVMCGNGQIFAIQNGRVMYRTDVDDENVKGSAWAAVDAQPTGVYTQITCGKRGQLMVIDDNNKVWAREDVTDAMPQGSSWTAMDQQDLKHVSLGLDGRIWGVGTSG